MSAGLLCIVSHGTLPTVREGGGRVKLSQKTVTGMAAYAKRWPGPVAMLARPGALGRDATLGADWTDLSSVPFELHLATDLQVAINRLAPAVTLVPHHEDFAPLLARKIGPTVLLGELSAMDQARFDRMHARSSIPRARIRLGALRRERSLRTMAAAADAMQFNGWTAYDAYSNCVDDGLLFYDTRLSSRHLESLQPAPRVRSPGQPLRIGFSGRYLPQKGPAHVLAVSRKLSERSVPHSVTMVGSGPLEAALRASAGPAVSFRDLMPFDDQWLRWVRDEIDLMLLPHLQGDPSGTYLEASAMGAPPVGYDNPALAGLVRNCDLGAVAGLGDADALTDLVAQLATNPKTLGELGARGIAFMHNHPYEREFDHRVAQLRSVADH